MRVKQVKQKVDGYEVGGVMADQESCIFTEFKIIKCKPDGSFLKTLQWFPISLKVKNKVLKMV